MIDEGYIKFNCKWKKTKPFQFPEMEELNFWRGKFYRVGVIGEFEDGIGFGNLSVRIGNSNQFVVSGTQTGGIPELSNQHYTKVVSGSFEKNQIVCKGPVQASSESLTHLAVYQADQNVRAIIHVHDSKLWNKLIDQKPTTDRSVAYGTPEMAGEILQLFREGKASHQKVIVMGGHQDGVIGFGSSIEEAAYILWKLL